MQIEIGGELENTWVVFNKRTGESALVSTEEDPNLKFEEGDEQTAEKVNRYAQEILKGHIGDGYVLLTDPEVKKADLMHIIKHMASNHVRMYRALNTIVRTVDELTEGDATTWAVYPPMEPCTHLPGFEDAFPEDVTKNDGPIGIFEVDIKPIRKIDVDDIDEDDEGEPV